MTNGISGAYFRRVVLEAHATTQTTRPAKVAPLQARSRVGVTLAGLLDIEMARRYRKIEPQIWWDEKFSQFNPTEKLVAIYCMTGPESNRIGLYVLSMSAGAENCGLTPETFRERFSIIKKALNWRYDDATRMVFIPSWWKYQKPDNPNAFKACLEDLDALPKSPLIAEFCANTDHLGETFRERLRNVTPNVPGTLPVDEAPGAGAGAGAGAGVLKASTDVDDARALDTPSRESLSFEESSSKIDSSAGARRFRDFWNSVHTKVGKAAAQKAFTKAVSRVAKERGIDLDDAAGMITRAMTEFAATPSANPSDRTPIHPSTWLNQGRYDDDPDAWRRDGLSAGERRTAETSDAIARFVSGNGR